jgi:hypothetical protein
MPSKSSGKRTMSDEHKAALATGRSEGRAVRTYLEALEAHKPKRGRKRTPESIGKRIDTINAQLDEAEPVTRLKLVQERMDLEAELASNQAGADLPTLEADFVKVARSYGERNGISYAAWREIGVQPSVLKAAGIRRGA